MGSLVVNSLEMWDSMLKSGGYVEFQEKNYISNAAHHFTPYLERKYYESKKYLDRLVEHLIYGAELLTCRPSRKQLI